MLLNYNDCKIVISYALIFYVCIIQPEQDVSTSFNIFNQLIDIIYFFFYYMTEPSSLSPFPAEYLVY
jgi:hypothetical protein